MSDDFEKYYENKEANDDISVHDADVVPLHHDHNDQYLLIGFLIIMETW